MKIENTPYYEMFSDEGNAVVHRDIVLFAREAKLNWRNVQAMLNDLSRIEKYSEASDTAVREAVYFALFAEVA